MINEIRKEFIERYGNEPMIVTSPGRVNLIGEHTDYNKGFVLPGAIDKKIVVAIAKNNQQKINVFARHFNEAYSIDYSKIEKPKGWQAYIAGVSFYVQEKTQPFDSGFDVMFDGDVPVGSGMSSSAALCSAYGFALNELFGSGLTRMQLAYIGQQTEHNFAGVKVGIMDQFASLHGKKGNVMKLDCRSMDFEYIPFDFPDHRIVLVNSMVHHSLAGTEYNVRRNQCEEGVSIVKRKYSQVESLRDVTKEMLLEHENIMPEIVFRRCKFVIEENERLLKGCDFLRAGDLASFGKLMDRSHEGLSKEYEVSCPELDFLHESAKKLNGVKGSRMMGGGFGGCTINIVESSSVDEFTAKIQKTYNEKYAKVPDVYISTIEDGTRIQGFDQGFKDLIRI